MSLRQQWNWLLKFGCNAEETNETTQHFMCCDSSAALGMIKRQGSTRKTRHIELKTFFLQQWSGRPDVGLVQVEMGKILADCSTKIQSTPNSVHLSRPGLDIKSSPEQIGTWSKRSRGGVDIPFLCFKNFVILFFSFLPVLCGTHHTFYNELRVDFIHAAAHFDRSSFCCLMEFRVAETTDGFYVVLLFAVRWIPVQLFHTSGEAPSCTRGTTSTSLSLRSLTTRSQFCRWRTRSQFT